MTTTDSSQSLRGTVRRTVLPGGLRVLTETMPEVRSVSFGIWVGVGSRDETAPTAGCSHYLEHLLFKGTERRTALEISAALDAVGGDLNAFTTKEYTCYYARVLDSDLPLAVDVVSDMVISSNVTADDLESERNVILEEIAMHDDDPGDVVHDVFTEAVLGDVPLGRPVLGTVESIESLSRDTVDGFYRQRYHAPAMVVAAAGNVAHEDLVALVEAAFADRLTGGAAPDAVRPEITPDGVSYRSRGVLVTQRPTEQANVVLGTRGVHRRDDRRFALGLLCTALGGGMSSRLFQEIREKRGLAYSVYAFTSSYADTGLVGVYAGCTPKRVDDVLALSREQLDSVLAHNITAEELARAKGQTRGGLVLGLEDSGSRMSRLGKAELLYGEHLTVDEILARVEAVTLDDIAAVAGEVLRAPLSLGVIGPFDDHDFAAAVA